MTVSILCLMFLGHFVSDFMLQSDWMAINKSKQLVPLLAHCGIYTLFFIPFGLVLALIIGALHFATDYWTSRLNSYTYRMWHNGEPHARHWFFVGIGFDQLIHAWVIIYFTGYWYG
jgi:hypothetical protein